ncbi:hypothetical protein [Synechococcus sp. BO 8801]|uniref:tetratricopeptide repeat protein n=1 Tax=Synechococcus sp. BO 8801 TaxID=169670 RepID=UPI0011817291|nr:hypothetical protein [Synechococcus sp. BO 8801]
MRDNPPTNKLSYLARKAICPRLEIGDFIGALSSAETILSWNDCRGDSSFQEQVISIINYCRPLAERQRKDLEESARRQKIEREIELERQAEIIAKKRLIREQTIAIFGPLAEKYGAPSEMVIEDNEPSTLVIILQELDEASSLSEEHYKWLIKKKLYLMAARACYKVFQKSGDLWALAKSGKSLRKAGKPDKVIELVTDQFLSGIQTCKVKSALLTNRAGAKRDLHDLEGARGDGHGAVKINPQSFHPHNLLGAVYYQAGEPQLGDKHFEIAISLGASREEQDNEIKSALQRSTPEARVAVVEYLLAKNPVKYAWLRSMRIE